MGTQDEGKTKKWAAEYFAVIVRYRHSQFCLETPTNMVHGWVVSL